MSERNGFRNDLFFSRTNDFLNIYLPSQAVRSACTVKTYLDGLTVFRRYVTDTRKISMKKFRFSDCTHDFLLDFMAHLRDRGCKESTCNNRLAAVKSYLWYAADGDVSLQSIALGASRVPFMKETKPIRETIPDGACAAMLAAPNLQKKNGLRDMAIMVLLYDSAMRVSELLGLTLSSLYLDAAIPYVRIHGKGDKERIVSLTDKTVAHLRTYLSRFHVEECLDKPLFYTVIKGHLSAMSSGNVERIITKYADQVRKEHPEMPRRPGPHMLRRTRATGLYQDGVELELVSRILGHSSTQTTRIYATPSMKMMQEAMGGSIGGMPEEEPLWTDNEDELARICGLR